MNYGYLLGIAFVIFIALWIRNIIKAMKSGEFQRRLQAAKGENPFAQAAREMIEEEQRRAATPPDPTPDRPTLYGRFADWIAVRAEGPEAVAEFLGLQDVATSNWESGCTIATSRTTSKVFLGGSIDGWVLMIGRLPDDPEDASEQGMPALIKRLSRRFGDAQYYFFSSTTMVNGWIRAIDGEIVRAYWLSCYEAPPRVVLNEGTITEGERRANCVYGESGFKGAVAQEEVQKHPDCCLMEEATSDIAREWSIDPDGLRSRNDLAPSTGLVASWPQA